MEVQDACELYAISVDEFLAWERDLDRYGLHGLRTTRYQIYRDTDNRAPAKSGERSCETGGVRTSHARVILELSNRGGRTLGCDGRGSCVREYRIGGSRCHRFSKRGAADRQHSGGLASVESVAVILTS